MPSPSPPEKPLPEPRRLPRFDWRDFSLRNTLNNHSSAVTIVAVVLLLISLGLILLSNDPRPRLRLLAYYYDLNTQRILVDRVGREVPFDRGNGSFTYFDGPRGSVVGVTIYTCGDPADVRPGMTASDLEDVGAYIVSLHRMSPAVLGELTGDLSDEAGGVQATGTGWSRGELVSDIEGAEWVPLESDAGETLLMSGNSRCGDAAAPRVCLP